LAQAYRTAGRDLMRIYGALGGICEISLTPSKDLGMNLTKK